MIKYKYVGNGLGVFGLPHEIDGDVASEWEAEYRRAKAHYKRQGISGSDLENALAGFSFAILQAGLDNGNYAEIKSEKKKQPKQTAESGQAETVKEPDNGR